MLNVQGNMRVTVESSSAPNSMLILDASGLRQPTDIDAG